jgi:putative transposase
LNHKKCFRLYREEGLTLRYKRKKRKYTSEVRVPPAIPERRDQRWTIDFVSDSTSSGQAFRVLTAVDVKTRECVLLDPSIRFPSSRVTLALDRLIAKGRKPDVITLDNGTEFTCKHFDAWAYQRGIQLDFIRPGRPAENCHIELFNGRLRDECLNVHWWKSVDEARTVLEDWRRDYNEVRPHSSLSDLVPAEYVARLLGLTPAGMKERQLTG